MATLKDAGLVRGDRDASDGRKVLISATETGRELFLSLLRSRKAWLAEVIDTVVEADQRAALDTAIELLERLAGADLRLAATR
ncbi:MAG TPA: hypothetical protein VFX16_27950 [Pseudonocardiaceae bacterium]|nr:hypothetical protein [Pseudonocardiaceae bacterium]